MTCSARWKCPADAYYGIHTLRAAANFDLSGLRLHPELIRALAEVKKACAIANARTGYLDQPIADAIGRVRRSYECGCAE